MPLRCRWRLLLFTAVLVLISLAYSRAFRPSSWTLLERTLLTAEDAEDLVPSGAEERLDRLADIPPLPLGVWDDGSRLEAGTSREGFLRNVIGVGIGVAAGMACEVEPASALFGEWCAA